MKLDPGLTSPEAIEQSGSDQDSEVYKNYSVSLRATALALAITISAPFIAYRFGRQSAVEEYQRLQDRTQELAGRSDRLDDMLSLLTGQDGIDSSNSLTPIEETDGYGTLIQPETAQSALDSTISVGRRLHGSEGPWEPYCNGTKIELPNGSQYILTSSQCFSHVRQPQNNTEEESLTPNSGEDTHTLPYAEPPASTIKIDDDEYEYAVMGFFNERLPLQGSFARISGISVESDEPGMALLEFQESEDEIDDFDKIPAIIYDPRAQRPKIGEEIVMASYTDRRGFMMGVGTYLGRISEPYHHVIGLNEQNQDVCRGAATMGAAALSNSGWFTGPRSGFVDTDGHGGFEERSKDLSLTLQHEAGLGIELLNRFAILCEFRETPTHEKLEALRQRLKGIDVDELSIAQH